MSETKVEIINWRYLPKKDIVELRIDKNGETLIGELSPTAIEEIVATLPIMQEEKLIKDMINAIHDVIKKRVLNVPEIDKALENLRKDHDEARKELKKATDKIDVLKWNGIIKSLAAEKVVLAEKRHLIKLLSIEESDLRAKLAKILAGRR